MPSPRGESQTRGLVSNREMRHGLDSLAKSNGGGNQWRTVAICAALCCFAAVMFAVGHTGGGGSEPPSSKPLLRMSADEDSDAPWPRVAWLMSFPNSGTSYTLRLTQWSSNITAASNYGDECDVDKDGVNIPLYKKSVVGPHIKFAKKHKFPTGESYVLTKTHCGGRCTHCDPAKYVETTESFKVACLSGNRYAKTEDGDSVELLHEQRYDKDLVKRAVHVIRDPFDNVVARFHLDWGKNKKDDKFVKKYPNDPDGFRKWCTDIDEEYLPKEQKSRFIDKDLIPLFEKVPCHGDFFRWVQWHNLAVATTAKMNLPTFLLHYENYKNDFEGTKTGLMSFLQLDIVGEVPEFVPGKTYRDFYTEEERKAALKIIEKVATAEAWELLERYNYV
mmetsp:Transcript_38692/g.116226  ORF Transcript_38692/g.116226 Transcript_38692/m.116226 type:complete len:390 (-) Transcript_38692:211-1380(-)|eukprot:CAMPEP_0113544956 /NCGR_PEP_ID=MMETSP0015_2-20120614/10994_1 /TAXON_ID=2838 /ORGANISM="Odontella" /LENGTH=389 /DNA_ID=CAMNT_0000445269 /DNA_START=172 /DNA_END=1341 /DNA_ORIENTATION=- /assembly_acc=CAM_ASM_000160